MSNTKVGGSLRLLSYNIQAGIQTTAYRHYLTRSWHHVLPAGKRKLQLNRIADVISAYDIVALQEADGGSLRSGFVNQVEYLAERARFPFWYSQRNRNMGLLGQQGNGLLARLRPTQMEDHKLPGRIPGRGAILCQLDMQKHSICLVIVHLSLGAKDRALQLAYLVELIEGKRHVILMGDMNVPLSRLLDHSPLKRSNLLPASLNVLQTYPSWRPIRSLDHVLISPGLTVNKIETIDHCQSDHLPLSVEISFPESAH